MVWLVILIICIGLYEVTELAMEGRGRHRNMMDAIDKSASWIQSKKHLESDEFSTQWLRGVGIPVSNLDYSRGYACAVVEGILESLDNKKAFREIKMPEDWCHKVIVSSTDKGTCFLAKKLNKNGAVSVQDAVDWIVLESKERNKSTDLN